MEQILELQSFLNEIPFFTGFLNYIVSNVYGFIVSSIVLLFLYFSRNMSKGFKFRGKWYRYGLGFFPIEGVRPIHEGVVKVRIFPRSIGIVSKNETYSYKGYIEYDEMIYAFWTGVSHKEKMLSIYRMPIKFDQNTILVGVKSCITKHSDPAANIEILSRKKLTHQEVRGILDRENSHIVVERAVIINAAYEK